MKPLLLLNSFIFVISFLGILLVFAINPFITWVLYLFEIKKKSAYADSRPSVSLVVVVYNGEELIEKKIENALSLDYPAESLEVVVFSDGSTDGTVDRVKKYAGKRVKLFSSEENIGKYNGMNKASAKCRGDILVFSDADAILVPEAINELVKHFSDPLIGGVCGQREICKDTASLKDAQKGYIRFDSAIKRWESALGSLTSNDGKLHAIRRSLYTEVPPGVTDDLFLSLSVIKKGFDFIFEPGARALVNVPSRTPAHELERRRRIVAPSLNGIFINRALFNPLKYGLFSARLFVNKVLRRLLPLFLIGLFISNIILLFRCPDLWVLFLLQFIFYLLAVSYKYGFTKKPSSLVYYFCIGNYGNLLGLWDFVTGKKVAKWSPHKADG
ncbi:MAG: glycosyltransferase [Thermodesulfobacteriota bacterium]